MRARMHSHTFSNPVVNMNIMCIKHIKATLVCKLSDDIKQI